ncbi:MAG: TSUP family transporter [Deltaproteobacteria bacterium]|nr:TSUP family transporter [Deltaproteobacteria bacterium]
MSTLEIVLLSAAAFFAGTVDAIAGGGGLVTVPALFATGLDPQLVYGTNKGQSVWGSGAALVAFWRAGRIDRRQAMFAFPLGFAGAALGAWLVLQIDKALLRPLAIAMLIGATVLLLIRKPHRSEDDPGVRRPWVAAILAFVIGAYDGFFGPGTGTFLIVGFVALCGKSLVHATADAKVVNFASNLASVITFAAHGAVVWAVAIPMAAGQLCGGLLGVRLAIKGGARLIRIAVLTVSGALVIKLVIDLVRA